MSDYESHALWRIYCGPTEGVAIQTTLAKLRGSVGKLPVHRITYGAPGNERRTPTLVDLATKKRQMFEYEHEVRVVCTGDDHDAELVREEFGYRYGWKPEKFVEAIAVHPEADRSFMETVVALVKYYAPILKDRISWSVMKDRPPLSEE